MKATLSFSKGFAIKFIFLPLQFPGKENSENRITFKTLSNNMLITKIRIFMQVMQVNKCVCTTLTNTMVLSSIGWLGELLPN